MEDFVLRGDSWHCALEPIEAVLLSRTLIETAQRTILVTGIPVPQAVEAQQDLAEAHPLQGLSFTLDGASHQILDPAVSLILPDGVPTNPKQSAEFRELTQRDLAAKKVARLLHWGAVISHADNEFAVPQNEVLEFVAALNDARLLLHARRQGTAQIPETERAESQDLRLLDAMFDSLTWLAGALLEAADGLESVREDLDS